jgi:hypothetical protein
VKADVVLDDVDVVSKIQQRGVDAIHIDTDEAALVNRGLKLSSKCCCHWAAG